jgi:hypothetical protein
MGSIMAEEANIWQYLNVADFEVPASAAGDATRGRLLRLWNSIQVALQPTKDAVKKDRHWERLPAKVLAAVAPLPDWQSAATQLAAQLGDDWLGDDWLGKGGSGNPLPESRIRTLVGPPGCDVAEVLSLLAGERGFQVISEPSAELLLEPLSSGHLPKDLGFGSSDEVLVIPNLERWFLRHEDGLAWVRSLLERLESGEQRVLVGCGSWAWAFLQRAMGIEDRIGSPWTWAPFDAMRLEAWLRFRLDLGKYSFRQSENDEAVFREPLQSKGTGKSKENGSSPRQGGSKMLRSLAAEARGNPAVALALWRDCLRDEETDEKEATSSDKKDPSSDRTAASVIWVSSPTELSAAPLPIDIDRDIRFILHALLLHGGLSPPALFQSLPFSLAVYPQVRQDLSAEGFLTDGF